MNASSSWLVQRYALYSAYCIEGSLIGGANLVIVVCLLRYEALRNCNQYLFMVGQSLADVLHMTGYATAGAYRLGLMIFGAHNAKVSLGFCAILPHRIMWGLAGARLTGLIQLLSAFDRLLSVLLPLQYVGWSRRYPLSVLSMAYGLTLSLGSMGVYRATRVPALTTAPCDGGGVVRASSPAYQFYYRSMAQIYYLLALPIYLAILVIYKHRMKSVEQSLSTTGQQKYQLQQQRRFTTSLLLNAAASVVFFVLPVSVGQIVAHLELGNGETMGVFPMLNFALSNIYPLCDVIIVSIRHDEVKQAVRGVWSCKTMPLDIKQWKANAAAKRHHVTEDQQWMEMRNKAPSSQGKCQPPPKQEELEEVC